ncbi:hypothetical protein AVEN_208448-1 [Araneus ventricosus]|uniref:Uncharacterized protein n=1 Tax=Araneus ventricosus TaxID=182803 RepID=A0A4Y2EGA9_ARAVE|nr:hypothetical protein AVEN_208448-1 [Araneus ventricosus]
MFLCCRGPPPRSPDLKPCDFFLWGYVKDKVYVPPMPTTLQALQERITAVVTDIDGNMLLNVWMELDYSWDVCRVTIVGPRIEHLYFTTRILNRRYEDEVILVGKSGASTRYFILLRNIN